MVGSNSLLACTCVVVAVVNVFILMCRLSQPIPPTIESSSKRYAYVGDDHPMHIMSFDDLPRVSLEFEESVHFGLGKDALNDWENIREEEFRHRIGPKYQAFVASSSHVRHCLMRFHRALYPDLSPEKMLEGHTQHCLAYVRQMVLCNPDLTLEPPDVLSRQWEIDRTGATHVCRDWSAARGVSLDLAARWQQFKTQVYSDL